MVSIKEAVEQAVQFARDLLGPNRAADLRLEETEAGKVGPQDVWLVTLSMPSAALIGVWGNRDYKTFTVSRETGEVLSMKIREVAKAD